MEVVDYYLQDPVVQLVIFVTLVVCAYDAFKFILEKFANLIGFKDDE